MCQRLTVGIGDQKIDAIQISIDHVVDGIAACAANTDNGDARAQFLHGLRNRKVDGHASLPFAMVDHGAAGTDWLTCVAACGCGRWHGPTAPQVNGWWKVINLSGEQSAGACDT